MSYLLPLLLPLSLYLIFLIRSYDQKNLPPGSDGWPILGENLDYAMLGVHQLVRDRMKKYSPKVFKTLLFRQRMAVLCGAPGNKTIFKNENNLFTTWLPPSLRKVVHQSAGHAPSNEAKVMFRIFQHDVLRPEILRQHIPAMDAAARGHLDRWWDGKSAVEALPSVKKFAHRLAWRLFMDVEDLDRVDGVLEAFNSMTNGLVSVDLNLPGTAFRRAVEGGEAVRGELVRIVKERREGNGRKGRDLLSKMVFAMDEDGKLLDETKIANFMIGLLVGSQYEVSSAITVVLDFLARLPQIYDHVLREQMEIAESKGDDGFLTWKDMEKMKYLWNVVCECFRLAPPTLGSFREATAEFNYEGYTIPKGWKVMWSTHSCHRNPDYFPEPEKFDPSRFEGSGPAPYTYVPFGGGPRMCPGRDYAKLVILVFIHNVVKRFRLEKVIPNEKMMFHVTPAPVHGLPLRLHPHGK